jgi:hypothetical protein
MNRGLWPPCSLDLKPCKYLACGGVLKEEVCKTSEDDLGQRGGIQGVVPQISPAKV